MPECLLAFLCRIVGWSAYYTARRHRQRAFSNLHHVFPEKDRAWRRKITRECFCRMAEMGLFVIASPYFSERRIRKMFRTDASVTEGKSSLTTPGEPLIILVPHFSLMESLTRVRVICRDFPDEKQVGVFYRPFGKPAVERWVKKSREFFGIQMLSRKAGFWEAMGILQKNGAVAVLFDQKTGGPGALSVFMGRIASSSELAGLLSEKYKTRCVGFYAERTGFWRGVLRSEFVCENSDADTVTIASNIWLEKKLRQDDNHCADWLWLHRRWQTQHKANKRFRLEQKRDILAKNLAALGLKECPRNERFWMRMPDSLEEIKLAVPLIRELRISRPDAAVTLIADKKFEAFLRDEKISEKIITLPERGRGYFKFFEKLRGEYPDTHVVFAESEESGREAELIGAPQRFGVCRKGQTRRGLTHCWQAPENAKDKADLWRRWFESHGLPPVGGS